MTGILERGEPVLCPRSTPGHPSVNFFMCVRCDSDWCAKSGLCLDEYSLHKRLRLRFVCSSSSYKDVNFEES